MHWLYLALAILFEVMGTISMKLSDGFKKPMFSTTMVVGYIISFAFITFALKKIDIGMAYAIWAGVGTALIATIGIVFFHEKPTAMKILCILLIIIGSIGLKLSEKVPKTKFQFTPETKNRKET